MKHGFLVHNSGDHVGVAVRDLEAGDETSGLYMDSNERLEVRTLNPIPLGHKIALADVEQGSKVMEYGVSIGIATETIRQGQHVHTHNIRSARW